MLNADKGLQMAKVKYETLLIYLDRCGSEEELHSHLLEQCSAENCGFCIAYRGNCAYCPLATKTCKPFCGCSDTPWQLIKLFCVRHKPITEVTRALELELMYFDAIEVGEKKEFLEWYDTYYGRIYEEEEERIWGCL